MGANESRALVLCECSWNQSAVKLLAVHSTHSHVSLNT